MTKLDCIIDYNFTCEVWTLIVYSQFREITVCHNMIFFLYLYSFLTGISCSESKSHVHFPFIFWSKA